jgi:hypothetical protein
LAAIRSDPSRPPVIHDPSAGTAAGTARRPRADDPVQTATIEARWWLPGTLPDDILDWFRSRTPVREDRRTDHYLIRTASPDVGVTRRAGDRLELKVRTARHDGLPLGHGVGHVEWWTKWTFGAGADQPLAGPEWTAVHKQRWVHDLNGCAVELVVVTIADDDRWWGIGLESPADTHRPDDLDRVLRRLFAVTPPRPIRLAASMSRGYAEHLCACRRSTFATTAPGNGVHAAAATAAYPTTSNAASTRSTSSAPW